MPTSSKVLGRGYRDIKEDGQLYIFHVPHIPYFPHKQWLTASNTAFHFWLNSRLFKVLVCASEINFSIIVICPYSNTEPTMFRLQREEKRQSLSQSGLLDSQVWSKQASVDCLYSRSVWQPLWILNCIKAQLWLLVRATAIKHRASKPRGNAYPVPFTPKVKCVVRLWQRHEF